MIPWISVALEITVLGMKKQLRRIDPAGPVESALFRLQASDPLYRLHAMRRKCFTFNPTLFATHTPRATATLTIRGPNKPSRHGELSAEAGQLVCRRRLDSAFTHSMHLLRIWFNS